jgi:dephospho-CoA kinase
LVTAEDNIKIKRVMDRDQKTYREIEAIMQKQMPEKEKIKKADFIIENNSDLETLKSFTKQTINELEKMDL